MYVITCMYVYNSMILCTMFVASFTTCQPFSYLYFLFIYNLSTFSYLYFLLLLFYFRSINFFKKNFPRQDKPAILGEILPHSPFFRPHVYRIRLFPSFFRLISKMVPNLCYKLNHGTHLLFFRPHVYGFCLFSPIFRSFSTYFPPNLLSIFHWSCLART